MDLLKIAAKNIPKGFYNRAGLGLTILSVGLSIALIKSSNVSFSDGDRTLQLESRQKIQVISNDAEHAINALETKVHYLENDIEWLKAEFQDPMFQKALELIDETIQREIEPNIKILEEVSQDLEDVSETKP